MRTLLCQRRVASGLQCRRMTLDSTRHSEYVLSSCMTCLLHLWLHYMWIVNPSVVCNVRAPYWGGWNFRQYFFAVLYLSHPLTSVQNFTEILPGEPLHWGGGLNARGMAKWWTYRRLYLIPVSRSGCSSLDVFCFLSTDCWFCTRKLLYFLHFCPNLSIYVRPQNLLPDPGEVVWPIPMTFGRQDHRRSAPARCIIS